MVSALALLEALAGIAGRPLLLVLKARNITRRLWVHVFLDTRGRRFPGGFHCGPDLLITRKLSGENPEPVAVIVTAGLPTEA